VAQALRPDRANRRGPQVETLRGHEEERVARNGDDAGMARRRDPEDRVVDRADGEGKREKMFDKTMADSFPASDPPSSLPDPSEDSFEPT
jgi:hypothetical protein